jgi:hypothetical protein
MSLQVDLDKFMPNSHNGKIFRAHLSEQLGFLSLKEALSLLFRYLYPWGLPL